MGRCDSVVAGCLFPLALIILISGLDDLALAAICLWAWVRGNDVAPPESQPSPATKQNTIAIFAKRTKATAGLILLDRSGNPGFAFNTPRMAYGYVAPDGSFLTAV